MIARRGLLSLVAVAWSTGPSQADGDHVDVQASAFGGMTAAHPNFGYDDNEVHDVVGNVAVNAAFGAWSVGVEQPYLLLRASRLDPPSGFRHLRLNGGVTAATSSYDGALDGWLSIPTADANIAKQDAGISGEARGDRIFCGRFGVGLAARAGFRDDWIQLDLSQADYVDASARLLWRPESFDWNTKHFDIGASGGITQLYGDQRHLIPHAEATLSFLSGSFSLTARLAYIYNNDAGLWMLSLEPTVHALVRR